MRWYLSGSQKAAKNLQLRNRSGIVAVMALKVGVICRSCGRGIEVGDPYVAGTGVAGLTPALYGRAENPAPPADLVGQCWQKILRCVNPDCGELHVYTAEDLRLFDE